MYIVLAFASAIFAGITAILAKIGIKEVNSTLATALRTIVVVFFAWTLVIISGSITGIMDISAKSLLFLVLSGLATGGSWLCYFKALQIGDINKVVPIDKSSTVLTMIFAIIFLGEELTILKAVCIVLIAIGTYLMLNRQKPTTTQHIPARQKLEIFLGKSTVKNMETETPIADAKVAVKPSKAWLMFALLSAFFASLTAILGKVGIENIDSNLGTAIRTTVVLVMSWIVVIATKNQSGIKRITKKSYLFIALSGIATGASWLCYYSALKLGEASIVVPIDKLSLLVTVAFSWFVFKEKLSKKSFVGLLLIVSGTLLLLVKV